MNWVTKLHTAPNRGWMEVSDVRMAAAPRVAASAPVIGISGSSGDSKSVAAIMGMVRALGATPLFIGNHAERIRGGVVQGVAETIASVDAVLLMGNNEDIDPAKYREAAQPQTKIEQDYARAAFEEELIHQSIATKMPLMGICGGMQRINVACGGSLHQHIADIPEIGGTDGHNQAASNLPGFVPVQQITIQPNTLLAAIDGNMQGRNLPENSFHHQALKLVAKGLRVNAVADDGIAEGIEAAPGDRFGSQFIVGVQFHPEFGASTLGTQLIGRLIHEGKHYAQTNARTHHPAEAMVETIRSSLDVQKTEHRGFVAALQRSVPPVAQQIRI